MKKQKQKVPFTTLFKPNEITTNLSHLLIDDYDYTNNIVDPVSFNFDKQVLSSNLLKKYKFNTTDGDLTRDRAYQKFIDIHNHLVGFNLQLEGVSSDSCRTLDTIPRRSLTLLRARNFVHTLLGEPDIDRIFSKCKHGPKSSMGVNYNEASLTTKFRFPMTATVRGAKLFNMYLMWDHVLRTDLQSRYPEWKFSFRDLTHYDIVESSIMGSVPKNDEIDRTIAKEPTVNAFIAQGVGREISDLMASFGVDIESQQKLHQVLAYVSSITKSYATIDWTSASDCVSLELIKYLVPPKWFELLSAVRTDSVSMGTGLNKNTYHIRSYATMGNACTFPLETLVFFALAKAVQSFEYDKTRSVCPEWALFDSPITLSIFGDDCIVKASIADEFIQLCESLGFIKNESKTFLGDSCFRESCGADFLSGRNVRSIYIRRPASNKKNTLRAWLYIVTNQVLKKVISTFGPDKYIYNSSALRYLLSLVSQYNKEIFVVPEDFPDDSGLKIISDFYRIVPYLERSKIAPITCDIHGTLSFKALGFVSLKQEEKPCEAMLHWDSLRNLNNNRNYINLQNYLGSGFLPPDKVVERLQQFDFRLVIDKSWDVDRGNGYYYPMEHRTCAPNWLFPQGSHSLGSAVSTKE